MANLVLRGEQVTPTFIESGLSRYLKVDVLRVQRVESAARALGAAIYNQLKALMRLAAGEERQRYPICTAVEIDTISIICDLSLRCCRALYLRGALQPWNWHWRRSSRSWRADELTI